MDALAGFLVTLVMAYAAFIIVMTILGELYQFVSANAGTIFVLLGGGIAIWIAAMAAKKNKVDADSWYGGSSSTDFHHSSGEGTSASGLGAHTTAKSTDQGPSGEDFSEGIENPSDEIAKGWLELGPDACSHCQGTGICQDLYHSGGPDIVKDLVIGADCPSGCSGSSIGAGECPHCDGSGCT